MYEVIKCFKSHIFVRLYINIICNTYYVVLMQLVKNEFLCLIFLNIFLN